MNESPRDPIAVITVLELAPPARALVDTVVSGLSRRVGVPCRQCAASEDVQMPYIPGRNQVDADRLLEHLEGLERGGEEVLVGLTGVDIGNPIFTHFFGRARHGGGALLVSTARLTPAFYGLPEDEGLTADRTILEIFHELGHVVGLPHCNDFNCIMRFAPVVEQIDNRGRYFCATCRESVPASLLGPAAGHSHM